MQDDYGNVTLVNVSGIYDEQPLFIDKLKKGGAGEAGESEGLPV